MKKLAYFVTVITVLLAAGVSAQTPTKVESVEVKSPAAEAEVGKPLKFSAVAKDGAGKALADKPSTWFAAPFDLAHAQEDGTVTFFQPGEVLVGAIVGGKAGFTKIIVKTMPVAKVDINSPKHSLVVGGRTKLSAVASSSNGDPRKDAVIEWSSASPSIARVDAAGLVTAVAPGTAVITGATGTIKSNVTVTVAASGVTAISIDPGSTKTRTGDVVRLNAKATGAGGGFDNYAVSWSVEGSGAQVFPDGGFVAELPGTYVITATHGNLQASSSIVVAPRNAERSLDIIGHVLTKDIVEGEGIVVQAAEQWIFGNYAYVSTIHDKLLVYDITDPAKPTLTDTVKVDARTINDVSTTADGKIGVITREGASNRKNGIVFLDTSDPAHPKIISEYTLTVTGGVHSAFIDGHYVYLTDDATGSMRVIDFKDVKNPKEVARWQVESSAVTTFKTKEGEEIAGRYLHDLQVKDGLAYLAYWRDGMIVLDVGNGIKGGSPEKPTLVSQFRFNHHELYGNGWLAGTHSVFRYKNYVFVGDEVFPPIFDIQGKSRIPVRGIVHVVDVSDIANPRKVAEYSVPEAGAHNMWVDNDMLYMGYYSGGGRVLDVSGELRGELYRQGREISHLWGGHAEGFRANLPFTWGAQPHKGMIFFNDINSGLWIVKLGGAKFKGSTTEPGQ
ncbi:MAG TPA: Ig-like domain-containing protein [Pyrinomonadaceae bacterium]|nr:Ig-like domain-containing protein [Pyrinomonadaceae bacterium]